MACYGASFHCRKLAGGFTSSVVTCSSRVQSFMLHIFVYTDSVSVSFNTASACLSAHGMVAASYPTC